MIIWWNMWKAILQSKLWWIVVLPPIAYIFWVLTFLCLTKGDEDKKTAQRQVAVFKTLNHINNTQLKNSDVKLNMGSYSGWIEARFDPKKSKKNQLKNYLRNERKRFQYSRNPKKRKPDVKQNKPDEKQPKQHNDSKPTNEKPTTKHEQTKAKYAPTETKRPNETKQQQRCYDKRRQPQQQHSKS